MSETTDTSRELAAFLRTRRERLTPHDAELPEGQRPRRTPGLRREEVAELAKVSVDYVTRLEQGRGLRPSPEVLEALAGALQLSIDERAYLFDLAQRRQTSGRQPTVQAPPKSLARLVGDLSPLPTMLVDHRLDILAWNPEMAALMLDFGALPDQQRNALWLCLLYPPLRDFYPDHASVVRDGIADLRAAWAGTPRRHRARRADRGVDHTQHRVRPVVAAALRQGEQPRAQVAAAPSARANDRGVRDPHAPKRPGPPDHHLPRRRHSVSGGHGRHRARGPAPPASKCFRRNAPPSEFATRRRRERPGSAADCWSHAVPAQPDGNRPLGVPRVCARPLATGRGQHAARHSCVLANDQPPRGPSSRRWDCRPRSLATRSGSRPLVAATPCDGPLVGSPWRCSSDGFGGFGRGSARARGGTGARASAPRSGDG